MDQEFSFGRWLQERRRAMDLTQETLAEAVACSVDTIRKIERGVRRPSRQIAERLAEALAIPAAEWDRFVVLARQTEVAVPTLQAPSLPPAATTYPLPQPLTPMVGRDQALADVVQLVSTVRLVTVTGAGGVGKTRLAIQAAHELQSRFGQGVCFVELAPLADPALAPHAVAAALNLAEAPDEPLWTTLRRFLAGRHLLLVIDNCEHLLEASAHLCTALLQISPHLHVLTTSRERLNMAGEHLYPLEPLDVPAPGRTPAADEMLRYGAVQLFLARARAIQPDFVLSEETWAAVAELCRRLDGLPLALELAAARLRLLPLAHIVAQLDGRFRLLTEGNRMAPPRHRTLQALIDWSYELLSDEEQALFRRLAIFVGGWTLAAAQAVWATADDADGMLAGLTSLVDKSLIRPVGEACGQPRFAMLETMRAYGLVRLAGGEDGATTRRAHARFYLALAEAAEAAWQGPEQVAWLERMEIEHGNLRAALRWALDTGETEIAVRLAGALWWFWQLRGHFGEGQRWLEETLGLTGSPVGQAKVLTGAGTLAWRLGAYSQASAYHRRALALYREADDALGAAFALNNLGVQALCQGNYGEATALYEESLACYRSLGDPHSISLVLNNLGVTAQYQGQYGRAAELYSEGLALRRQMGDKKHIADGLFNLGEVALLQGDYRQAIDRYGESLRLWHELDAHEGIARCLAGLGGVAVGLGRAEEGAQFYSAAQAQFERLGLHLDPREQELLERNVAAARSQLDRGCFEAAWRRGQSLSLTAAVQWAMAVAGEEIHGAGNSPESPPSPAVDAMTGRETDILRLVATGKTDRQIAEQLQISPRTVGKHLQSIYRKLGVASRSGATRLAIEHDLA